MQHVLNMFNNSLILDIQVFSMGNTSSIYPVKTWISLNIKGS